MTEPFQPTTPTIPLQWNAQDPQNKAAAERTLKLFSSLKEQCCDCSINEVTDAAIMLFQNAIRQAYHKRSDCEREWDQMVGKAKAFLLDNHYDAVTGQRRSIFPWTQFINVPLHVEPDTIHKPGPKGKYNR